MKEYFLQLCLEFEERIKIIKEEHPDSYHVFSIVVLESVFEKLRKFIDKNPFPFPADEIYYFKVQKPYFISKLIYLKKINNIEKSIPHGSVKDKKEHLNSELNRLNRYFKANTNFIQYIQSGSTDLDSMYFIRENAKESEMMESYASEIDFHYGTGFDLRVGTIQAHILLENYLHEKLDHLSNPRSIIEKIETSPYDTTCGTPVLQWTDTQSSLVELIYGLYVNKTFNNGKADIKEIATFLEKTFNIKLNDVYRTFLDIKKRKTDKFKFIESMQSNLEEFSEDSFES